MGVHCVPIVDENNEVVNIISQSFLSNFVFKYRNEIEDTLSKTLVARGTTPVIYATSDMSVSDCLELLDSKHVTGVPVLDPKTHELMGNFSGTDLRYYLKNPTFDKLEMSVLQYIKKARDSRSPNSPLRPMVVSYHPCTLR